jgi:hypothetical protein
VDKYEILEEVKQLRSQYKADMLYESLAGEEYCRGAIAALNRVLKMVVGHCFVCFADESWEDCMNRYEVEHKEWMNKYSDFNPHGEGTWRHDD